MIISICEVAPQGACSFYRSIGPLSKLKKINPLIKTQIIPNVTWNVLQETDILFLARPDSKAFSDIIDMAHSMSIPIWIDWDDNVLEIPPWNPSYRHYAKEENKELIKNCIKKADIVSVSTETLKNTFSEYNKNIVVVENCFNDYNFKLEKIDDQFQSIFWRGSDTHRQDLLSVAIQMKNVATLYPGMTWLFLGGDPWYITDSIQNVFKKPDIDVITFQTFIKQNRSIIMQIPLVKDIFNMAKSNCGWIEGTYSGSAVIAPDLPEFKKPGIVNYDTPEKYQYYLEKLINSREYRLKNYTQSYEYIQENLLLSQINKKRIQIIEKVMDER